MLFSLRKYLKSSHGAMYALRVLAISINRRSKSVLSFSCISMRVDSWELTKIFLWLVNLWIKLCNLCVIIMNSIISSLCIVFMTALSAVGAQQKLRTFIDESSIFRWLDISTLNYSTAQDFPLCHRSDPKVNECLKNAIQASLLILGREGETY